MKVLTKLLIKSAKLTPAKSSPQDPVEYLQQVLVPECGRRLIAQDIQSGRTSIPSGVEDDDTLKTAEAIMRESAEFGNLVHPHGDDETEDDISNRNLSIEEVVEESKFSHFFDQDINSDNEDDGDENGKLVTIFYEED
jgi:hypothetical protein